jgi:phosphocarrier protein HPr
MSQSLKKQVEIINKLGLHARAAAKFVTTAAGFTSVIMVRRGEREVNGKSIMGVMMLAAAQGAEIEIEITGDDAEQAMAAMEALIQDRFGEES